MITTWEEAAQAAADQVGYEAHGGTLGTLAKDMRLLHGAGDWGSQSWAILAAEALHATPNFQLGGGHLAEVVETVISKQHDYGHGNILAYGIQGVCVRLSDKWARIQNLEKKGVDAQNESLLDSYLDLVGYCIIAVMLCEGTFELPLAEDLPKADANGWTDEAKAKVLSYEKVMLDIEQRVDVQIKLALDAHLAAFHPNKLPPSGVLLDRNQLPFWDNGVRY